MYKTCAFNHFDACEGDNCAIIEYHLTQKTDSSRKFVGEGFYSSVIIALMVINSHEYKIW